MAEARRFSLTPQLDDDDDSEDFTGGNRLFGFMFGNVDVTGDLDADYLDEDAKEHLGALADKLGSSLTDIDLSKSSPAPTDASEQDYGEKAEDAVDYEDIDEQYEGPEVQAATEEDHVLPKQEYFASGVSSTSLNHKASVFDDENYDEEEEEPPKQSELVDNKYEVQDLSSADEQMDKTIVKESSLEDASAFVDILPSVGTPETDMSCESERLQDEPAVEEQNDSRIGTSLPVLCVEEGMVILRFSEIFGIHEPLRKQQHKGSHRNYRIQDRMKSTDLDDLVEEDEEDFLKGGTFHDVFNRRHPDLTFDYAESDLQEMNGTAQKIKDMSLCSQPMKENLAVVAFSRPQSPSCPKFFPLDQQDWENGIVWGNSPEPSNDSTESCISEHDSVFEHDADAQSSFINKGSEERNVKPVEKDNTSLPSYPESFGPRKFLLRNSYQSRFLRPESLSRKDAYSAESQTDNWDGDGSKDRWPLNNLPLQNKELLDGSWLDQIIWDAEKDMPKPKLIFDLQDEQMLFEILQRKDAEFLKSRARAMVVAPSRTSAGEPFDLHNQGMASISRFNISNDKYYSNRKTSQQAKSHAKKRALMGIKVMHSVPALKLQTMKLKLTNKDLANFHRPRALWYPRDNEVAAKAQGMLTYGPMKIIILTLGGKGVRLHVDAEETLTSVKLKAAKKLDVRPSEHIKVFSSRKELDDDKTLFVQHVRPNSVLSLVRTRIYLWPKAQKLPGENKPVRPPGAFKKKSDLSVKDGHVFLMEYCEERPLLLGNAGMGARLCTYYQKVAASDQTALSLRNGNTTLGNVVTLDPADKSPFLGEIAPGCSQSCLETNMSRAPIFPHKMSTTDFLLVRSAKGTLSLRRIDKLYVVGQQEPHMEVPSPGTKNVQNYLINRMLVYIYREFRAKESTLPCVRADELAVQFPNVTDAVMRKRLKHCADLKRLRGVFFWVKRADFRIPSEEELRRMLTPENVCSYESMQVGLFRLKRLGIRRLTLPVGLSNAMNQLPDEAIALAAASHIERELQITPWNLSNNFVACTSQNRENIERLEISGVGDPSGRGLGFSYVRVTPKAPTSNTLTKKKAAAAKGSSSVTGTDADLRRLSMGAAREVLLKFQVPEEQIEKMTRWHRIAMVRKLSSEQAASGVKVDATPLSKFARGQRMSFLQLQQQTREKCQEIWDRQVQSLSAADADEIESDSDANSDLDSFAGDLENLLDAECEEEEDSYVDARGDRTDNVRGLKMRRCAPQAKTEEEIEDEKAEAAYIQKLLEGDGADLKKKKKKQTGVEVNDVPQLLPDGVDSAKKPNVLIRQVNSAHNDALMSKGMMIQDPSVMKYGVERDVSSKWKAQKSSGKAIEIHGGMIKRKNIIGRDGFKAFKEKNKTEKPVRENFVCGACGQLGHMKTNKNCPKYGGDIEYSEIDTPSMKSHTFDGTPQTQAKAFGKKLLAKASMGTLDSGIEENTEKFGSKLQAKAPLVKFKCGPSDKPSERNLSGFQVSDRQIIEYSEETKSTGKINKIVILNKPKAHEGQHEVQKSKAGIRDPTETDREQSRKKITIKQSKGVVTSERLKDPIDTGMDFESRKIKKIADLTGSGNQHSMWRGQDLDSRNTYEDVRWDFEHTRSFERAAEERTMRKLAEERGSHAEKHRIPELKRLDFVGMEPQKHKKKKKKKIDFVDDYLVESTRYKNDKRFPERDRAAKRRAVVDLAHSDYAPLSKRRRGGEVILLNILENIVESLKANLEVSYLFLKPVSKKDAPDYLDIVSRPMDLSTIRDKVRKMEYRTVDDFRHDVWQITFNAHLYNDERNPEIPPLADQLLELCDYLVEQNSQMLEEAQSRIED